MVVRNSLLERGQLGLRLALGHALANSCDRAQVSTGSAGGRCLSCVAQWAPDVDALIKRSKERLKIRRHHTDDCASDTVELNWFFNNRRIPIKAFLPELVTD